MVCSSLSRYRYPASWWSGLTGLDLGSVRHLSAENANVEVLRLPNPDTVPDALSGDGNTLTAGESSSSESPILNGDEDSIETNEHVQLAGDTNEKKKRKVSRNSKFELVLDALRYYRWWHPTDTRVPPSFKVPDCSPDYPKRLWGLKLGVIMSSMIHMGIFSEHHHRVEALGFRLWAVKRRSHGFEDILEALRCYRSLYPRRTRVPVPYKVPHGSSDYPSHIWGLKLGVFMKDIIYRGDFREHHDKLEAMGFALTSGYFKECFEDILEALRSYRSLYPVHKTVPYTYKVPVGSSDYPEHVWGMKLGAVMYRIVYSGYYSEHHGKLMELGFAVTTGYYEENIENIIEALRCFRMLHPKRKTVPYMYEVDEGSSDYPEHLWGMQLGKVMRQIKSKGYHVEHHGEIEQLGFTVNKKSLARKGHDSESELKETAKEVKQ